MLEKYIIPFIGSRGFWDIRSPFQTNKGALYTCKAVRKLSDYISSNEDALDLVYKPKGLGENEYQKDLGEDMVIVCLQTDDGYWHYVPASYLITYPDPNGIPYQKRGIYINLPAMPVARDISFLEPELRDKILSTLGVQSSVDFVEASQVTLVPEEKHIATDVARQAKVEISGTQYSRIKELETANQELIKKLQQLEAYIILKHKPESYYPYMGHKDLGALIVDYSNKSESRHNVAVPGMAMGLGRQGIHAP